jgi:DNA-binding CsgD family transcriptional regulator
MAALLVIWTPGSRWGSNVRLGPDAGYWGMPGAVDPWTPSGVGCRRVYAGWDAEGDDVPDQARLTAAAVSMTRQEQRLVRMVASGLSNKAIARQLGIAVKTVEFHLSNVYRKVGVASRGELAAWVSERSRASGAPAPLVDEATGAEPSAVVVGCDDVIAGNPFVGRDHERELVVSMLASPARLVTVIGAAGMGKTRLARHVAVDVADRFSDDVWFVELGPVASAASVADVVLAGIGGAVRHLVRRQGRSPSPAGAAGCSWCWTTASTCEPRPPTSRRWSSTPAASCWRRAGNGYGSPVSG